jgi:hypothetical protein
VEPSEQVEGFRAWLAFAVSRRKLAFFIISRKRSIKASFEAHESDQETGGQEEMAFGSQIHACVVIKKAGRLSSRRVCLCERDSAAHLVLQKGRMDIGMIAGFVSQLLLANSYG